MDNIYETLQGLLEWLIGLEGGAVIVMGIAFSWMIEKYPRFQALVSGWKWAVVLLGSIAIGFGANHLLTHPELLEKIEEIYPWVMRIFVVFITTQIAHKANPIRK